MSTFACSCWNIVLMFCQLVFVVSFPYVVKTINEVLCCFTASLIWHVGAHCGKLNIWHQVEFAVIFKHFHHIIITDKFLWAPRASLSKILWMLKPLRIWMVMVLNGGQKSLKNVICYNSLYNISQCDISAFILWMTHFTKKGYSRPPNHFLNNSFACICI